MAHHTPAKRFVDYFVHLRASSVAEGIVVIFMSQLLPWTEYNYMRELRVAVNQSLCDAPHWAPRPAL